MLDQFKIEQNFGTWVVTLKLNEGLHYYALDPRYPGYYSVFIQKAIELVKEKYK